MTYFEPSAARARSCRLAMDEALWSSVSAVLAEQIPGHDGSKSSPTVGDNETGPLDYGAYFDLVLSIPGRGDLPEEARREAVHHLRARFSAMAASHRQRGRSPGTLPRVTNLSPDCYSFAEIERFRRWWDIEPENGMGLTGLCQTDFELARQRIDAALDRLSQAAPEMHEEVLTIASDIVLSRPDRPDRFTYGGVTSFSLWGAFTINAEQHAGWPDYYRTIVHETGHNLLFAMARTEPLVADPADLKHHSPLRMQPRPMDGIFHAAFVSARESLAFDRYLCVQDEIGIFDPTDTDLLAGMLEQSVITFWDCHRILREEATITPLGEAILDECKAYMHANFRVETC